MRGQLHRLLKFHPRGRAFNHALHRSVACVVQLGVDSQLGGAQRAISEVRHRQRRAQCHRACTYQIDSAPQAHILVRRTGIPIHPVDAKIFFRRRKRLHGQHILLACLQEFRHIEVICPISAGDLGLISDLVPVQPNVAAVIDSAEVQPLALADMCRSRSRELRAIPPAAAVGAIVCHRHIGEDMADWVSRARNLAQIHAVIWIGKDVRRGLRSQHGAGHGRLQPALGLKSFSSNGVARGLHFAG